LSSAALKKNLIIRYQEGRLSGSFGGKETGENGGRRSGKTELKPAVVVLDYNEGWIKKKIDLVELVTLRKSGMTYKELAAHFGTAKSTISRYFRNSITGEES
jgi:DNA invertase Pin-like site-specific DNA recombinase